jgi:hypothetical protein
MPGITTISECNDVRPESPPTHFFTQELIMKRTKRQKTLPASAKATRMLRKKVSQAKVAYDGAAASAETSGHRTAKMGPAMMDPTLSNPELSTVSHERLLVGDQTAMAMMRRMESVHRIWRDFWFQQMQRSFTVLPQLAGSRTPTRLMQVATDSTHTLMSDLVAFWMKATNFSESVADAGAKPIHRDVIGNAKRLAAAV